MSHEFAGVQFPTDYPELLKMTQDILRTNRRLVCLVGQLGHTVDAMIDALDNDDGHRLAQLVMEYQAGQRVIRITPEPNTITTIH